MNATVRVQTSGPASLEAVRRALGGSDLASRVLPSFALEISAPTDLLVLSSAVAAVLNDVALGEQQSLVPERLSESHFNLRPAAG